jgi:hypothetical protein
VVGHAAAAHCRVWLHTAWPCKAGAWSEDFINVSHAVGVPTPFLLGRARWKGAHDQRNPQATA